MPRSFRFLVIFLFDGMRFFLIVDALKLVSVGSFFISSSSKPSSGTNEMPWNLLSISSNSKFRFALQSYLGFIRSSPSTVLVVLTLSYLSFFCIFVPFRVQRRFLPIFLVEFLFRAFFWKFLFNLVVCRFYYHKDRLLRGFYLNRIFH